MSDTVVITYWYREFWGTDQFKKSVERVGLPIYNAFKGTQMVGDGQILKWIYEGYLHLRDKYKYAIYSDAADTFFVKKFKVPDNKIIYSTEKAVWPPTDEMRDQWEDYYFILDQESILTTGKELKISPWKYLNGGNCCGPIDLIIEFFEKYGLHEWAGKPCNGQGVMAEAFLKAKADGFPIELDTNCEYFQTTGFAEKGELKWHSNQDGKCSPIFNDLTGSEPSVFHGNGRTNMDWLYKLYE